MGEYLLEMKNITKVFPGVKALDNVDIKVKKGEIHALVGENGAGKSTLMKVLSGVYPHGSFDGEIYFDGELCEFSDIKQSEEKGIGIIHQELALIMYLSIAENIFLGNEVSKKGVIDWDKTKLRTKDLLKKVRLTEKPETLIKDIGVGKQQLVEIAKALSKNIKLLILDEPTSALNEDDSQNLLNLILELKKHDVTSIIISHKLNEIEQISDSLTVLRDGKMISYLDMKKDHVTEDVIIKHMVGREITDLFPKRNHVVGDVIFEVKNWNADHPLFDRQILKDISLNVKKGEVVGIAGLMGAGRTELARSIFGKSYGRNISGDMTMFGQEVNLKDIPQAIKAGLAYVTEDRKNLGLILINDIKRNVTLANLDKVKSGLVVDENKEVVEVEEQVQALRVKCSSILQKTKNLSGGNQQKVVLSKWMFTNPEILILDEPTRGIDVGAKYEIYTIINQLAESGKAVIMISSELPEVIGMSDRIYVMSEGKITGELDGGTATPEEIMKHIVVDKKDRKEVSL
ncbi:multiple monosaccharide ABC transporter ATP-binding protein [Candidatus Xianfuyuplasma coldseepsis]|uniref:ATP-binding cassette domain-containing protein n=1 Tax=Candidatus Xianfuyuplasma coldseepsis TaxID=2782163 RepID=A0A7L7KU65_9MOLU|nr:multiple monosaccharide ABC transporter ATP-binding protein [Xianfuyuplasma coldseepsis]QMS85786.1 ATP-binding cassette domain-containing protein [Xianfuyuplasma coldseepsis]